MPASTVRLHRVLRAKPAKVYRAFVDAEALARWSPPNGYTRKVDRLDARIGGSYRMAFRNFSTGNGHSFGGRHVELVPGERLRYTDRFDDPSLPGEMMKTTVTLREVDMRRGARHRAGRHSRGHSGRILLPRLAGVAGSSGAAGRARDSRLNARRQRRRR